MKNTMVPSNPPSWWHSHGRKVCLLATDALTCRYLPLHTYVSFGSKTVYLTVRATEQKDGWHVAWNIVHGPRETSAGVRIFTDKDLLAAFGLNNYRGNVPESNCVAGQYARLSRHLNVPCKGTGSDGDPNVSIWIEEDMRAAIRTLVNVRLRAKH